jgi:hypothetical protein
MADERVEHTDGPWTLTHKSGNNFAVQEFDLRGMFGDAPNVYPIFNRSNFGIEGTTVHMHPADARLIAAAPDLLAALKLLTQDLKGYSAWERPVYAMDEALKAIAKAEGRS